MAKISKFGSEKVILSENGEPMFRRIMDADGLVTKDIPVTQAGYTKELTVAVILKRSYWSESDFTEHVGYFLQKYQLKMPNDRAMKYMYFYYEPKTMENVCVRNFDLGHTFSINVMSTENQKQFGITKVGEAVKISAEKAMSMLREKQVLGLFNDNGEAIVTV